MAEKIVHNHTPKSELEDNGLLVGIKEKIGDKLEERNEKKVEKEVEQHKAAMKSVEPEEKKGLIEKIKDQLPGGRKKEEDENAKIKDQLPGGHKKEEDENAPTAEQIDQYFDAEIEHKGKQGYF